MMKYMLVVILASATVYAGSKVAVQAVDAAHWILKKSESYSENMKYSKTIPYMYLGYNQDGETSQGVAMRSFKTYKRVTAMIALKRDNDKIVVDVVDIPDISLIKDIEKQEKVLEALKGIGGTVVQDASGKRHTIDAVTGATRYQKRIYLYLNKMSEALLVEMGDDPGWTRTPVKAVSK
jgi:hypothetical protein